MPVDALAGKIVLDTNNYMPWRDGHYPMVDAGEKTEHELRQEPARTEYFFLRELIPWITS